MHNSEITQGVLITEAAAQAAWGAMPGCKKPLRLHLRTARCKKADTEMVEGKVDVTQGVEVVVQVRYSTHWTRTDPRHP
jgi:hypothetical protein